jgi:hypothetical protein
MPFPEAVGLEFMRGKEVMDHYTETKAVAAKL